MAKKRANGEGSIRKKPNGRWEGRYTQGIDPSTGRAIQKSVSAKTQAECKEKLNRAIRDNRASQRTTTRTTPWRSGADCGLKPTASP